MSLIPPLSVPNNFVNGTIIDAGQMNANFASLLAWINSNGQQAIVTNLTLYVSPSGSDSNDGLTPGTPLATITAAYALLRNQYVFLSNSVVTIQLAPGTYNEAVNINAQVPGQSRQGNVVIQGSVGSPDTVVINGAPAITVNHGAMVTIQGVKLTSSGFGLFCFHSGLVAFQAIDFGACTQQIHARDGAYIAAIGNYTISGGANSHAHAWGSGSTVMLSLGDNSPQTPVSPGPTVTITGTPAFSSSFVTAHAVGVVDVTGATFTGSATGSQYNANDNGVILTGTGGVMTLPGNAAGTTARGGVYD